MAADSNPDQAVNRVESIVIEGDVYRGGDFTTQPNTSYIAGEANHQL